MGSTHRCSGCYSNNCRNPTVQPEDDLIEVTGLLRIEATKGDVVDDEDVRSKEAVQYLLGGMVGARLVVAVGEVIGS